MTAVLAATAGCAAYKPYSIWNDGGYSEQEVQPNGFRVRFEGNEHTSPFTTEDLAMLRAAELCLSRQMPFVELSSIHTERVDLRLAPRYVDTRFAASPTALNNSYMLPWSTRTGGVVYDMPSTKPRDLAVSDGWLFTPVSDLTAMCVPESREGVLDAAELAKTMRARHAKRVG